MTTAHSTAFFRALSNSSPDTAPYTLDDYFSLGIESFITARASATWLAWIEQRFREVLKNATPNVAHKQRLLSYLNCTGEFEKLNVLYTCVRLKSAPFFDFFLRAGVNPDRELVIDEEFETDIPKYTTTVREYARTYAIPAIQKLLLRS